MNRNFTLKDSKLIDKKEPAPSLKTTEFIKMFARSYKVDESLPEGIKEVYVN